MSDADAEAEVIVDRMAAAEAFELVADDTRLAILEALVAADGPVSFSTLRECADVADPGRFNYHLGKLTGAYVTKATPATNSAWPACASSARCSPGLHPVVRRPRPPGGRPRRPPDRHRLRGSGHVPLLGDRP